ncbi:MAG: hypothetical protein ABSD49_02555 [Candidatus Bathyarchaeia archaeon]
MGDPDQQSTRKLAELKSFLEKKIKQNEDELTSLRSYLEVVDTLLADRSFRKIEIPAKQIEQIETAAVTSQPSPNSIPVMTNDGIRIASMLVERRGLHVTPEPDMNLDANSPPLRSFLVGKVLESMQAKDKEAAASGAIQPEAILGYSVEQDGGVLKGIQIENYGDERRLLELKNAIRWTFRRMYEKVTAKPA